MTTMEATTETTEAAQQLPSRSLRVRAALRVRRATSSIRIRILVRFVVLLGLATIASLLLQRQALLAQLDERIDADLNQEATELRALVGGRDPQGRCIADTTRSAGCDVGRDPRTGRPFGENVRALFDTFLRRNIPSRYETMITFVDGQPYKVPAVRSRFAQNADDELLALGEVRAPARGELDAGELGRLRYLAVPIEGNDGAVLGVFAVAQYVDLQAAEVEQDLRLISLVDLALLAIASILAFIVAGRVLDPVRKVTETARSISETDLSQRINVDGYDEIAALSTTFNQMLERIERAFTTQRHFIDDAGHELRTPITIIRGHLETMGDDPAERRESLAIVTDELDRMTRMVDDLLVLAKADRPDFLRLEDVALADLTDEVHAKTVAIARRRWTIDHIGEAALVADRQRLTQALVQLAHNATEHTTEGDVIAIGSTVSGDQARLWVRDTGQGIHPDDRERIFGRFSRGHAGRRSADGVGLGLAIVRAIAEAHGGSVEVSSEVGAGATFTIVVPLKGPTTPGGSA